MESVYLMEGPQCATSLLKNVGLSHLHLVQNKLLSKGQGGKPKKLTAPEDIFRTLELMRWPATRE
jgi:hypothetical protein